VTTDPVDRISPAVLDLLISSGIAQQVYPPLSEKGVPMSEADAFVAFLEKLGLDEDLPNVLHLLAYNTIAEMPRPVLYSSFPQRDNVPIPSPYWLLFADGSRFFWTRDNSSWTVDFTPLSKQSQSYKIVAALNPHNINYFIITVEKLFEYLDLTLDPSLYPTRVDVTRPNTWQAVFSDNSAVACNSLYGLYAFSTLVERIPRETEVFLSKHS
jgi:hypothetical protein